MNGLTPHTWNIHRHYDLSNALFQLFLDDTMMLPAGVVAVLVGLWWVPAALKRRRRTAVQLDADTSVWMRPVDLARVAEAAAEDVSAVESVRASGKRKRVTVKVTTPAGDSAQVRTQVQEAVSVRLAPVATMPRIKVTTRTSGES